MPKTTAKGEQSSENDIRQVSENPMFDAEGLVKEPEARRQETSDIVTRYRFVDDDEIGRPTSIQGR